MLQDGRAFDVGLSDDVGGAPTLGLAAKNLYAPMAEELAKLDEYVQSTLFGQKSGEGLAEPHFSLQNLETFRIRMTVFYYHYTPEYVQRDLEPTRRMDASPLCHASRHRVPATRRRYSTTTRVTRTTTLSSTSATLRRRGAASMRSRTRRGLPGVPPITANVCCSRMSESGGAGGRISDRGASSPEVQ